MFENRTDQHALKALETFASETADQYVTNLALLNTPKKLFSNPLSQARRFDADGLKSAQSYTDESGDCFIILAHLAGSQIDMKDMETLVWLANDALAFDAIVKSSPDATMRSVAQLHGEKVVTQAVFLRFLLIGYQRSMDAKIIQRLSKGDESATEESVKIMERCAQEFSAAIEATLVKPHYPAEVVHFIQSTPFPFIPLTVGYKKSGAENLNGVWMSSDMAKELRAHLAAQQTAAIKK